MIIKLLQIAIPFIWVGLVAGLSFVETPLKFRAPGITLPLGLGIGRLVFYALNKIELVLAVVLIGTFILRSPANSKIFIATGIVAASLLLQTFWMLPVLDARAVAVIEGTNEPGSPVHIIYIAAEVIKLITLAVLGVLIARTYLATGQ
jgi:hypothetical protein